MSARLPVDVLVMKKEDEIFFDHPAIQPTIRSDGNVELAVDIWGGHTVFLQFDLAELVRIALVAKREEV